MLVYLKRDLFGWENEPTNYQLFDDVVNRLPVVDGGCICFTTN